MQKIENKKNSLVWYFIAGFGFGSLISYYYYSNLIILEQKDVSIKISDNNGNAIIKDYHFNNNDNTLYFKDNLENVNIKILFGNGENRSYDNFTGKEISL